MNWKAKNTRRMSIQEVVLNNYAGAGLEDLLSPAVVPPREIDQLPELADVLLEHLEDDICIVGDYDADGITATAILLELLRYLGADPSYHLPGRFSEGYGLSASMVEKLKSGLLITVDNGIAATDAIQAAKAKGLTVLILDHHLPPKALPPADVIVDPHISPERSKYVDYCGAGLALKLAELLFEHEPQEETKPLLERLTAYAAVGTVADVMPLTGDNRRIVKEGLRIMQQKRSALPCGFHALLSAAGIYAVTETEIAFKIAPMLNAAGRMLDNGAQVALEALLNEDPASADKTAERLAQINESRKNAVDDAMQIVDRNIADNCLFGDAPLCVYAPEISEGIIGIVTGKLAEKYRVPAFVFTDSGETGILRGSGRSAAGVNLMEVLSAVEPLLERFGGHAGAAGVSVSASNYNEMARRMHIALENYVWQEADEIVYDIELTAGEIPAACAALKNYAPFGQGNPAPVFCVRNIPLSPRFGSHYKVMGKNGEHLKLFGNGFSVVAFGKADDYRKMAEPMSVNVLGTITENVFQYAKEVQIEALDLQATARTYASSSLLEALRKNGAL